MQTETMKQTAAEVQSRRPEFRADEIWAVVYADPSLDASAVIESLEQAAVEHSGNIKADR